MDDFLKVEGLNNANIYIKTDELKTYVFSPVYFSHIIETLEKRKCISMSLFDKDSFILRYRPYFKFSFKDEKFQNYTKNELLLLINKFYFYYGEDIEPDDNKYLLSKIVFMENYNNLDKIFEFIKSYECFILEKIKGVKPEK